MKKTMKPTPTPYWTSVLERAPIRLKKGLAPFTEAQVKKASEWQTCACGKQSSLVKRDSDTGSPVDSALYFAGVNFTRDVEAANDHFGAGNDADALVEIRQAKRTMNNIEARACQLLRNA